MPVGTLALQCILVQSVSRSNHGFRGPIFCIVFFLYLLFYFSSLFIRTNVWFFIIHRILVQLG